MKDLRHSAQAYGIERSILVSGGICTFYPHMLLLLFHILIEQSLRNPFLPRTVDPQRRRGVSAHSIKSSAKTGKKNRGPIRSITAGMHIAGGTARKLMTSSLPLTALWIPTAKNSLVIRWLWSTLKRGPQRIQNTSCQKRGLWHIRGFHQSERRVSHPSPWAITS